LPVNNFKPHLIPLYWSSGIGPRGAIFLIRAALSSIIVQCTLMKKKLKERNIVEAKVDRYSSRQAWCADVM